MTDKDQYYSNQKKPPMLHLEEKLPSLPHKDTYNYSRLPYSSGEKEIFEKLVKIFIMLDINSHTAIYFTAYSNNGLRSNRL
jgi:hypothetical protein